MNDIISSSKIKKDRNTVSRTLPSKRCKYSHVNMLHVYVIHAILLHVTLFMIVLSNMWWKVIKKKLQVYTRLTAQDLHVYTIISNVIFFSAFLDIIIIITVIEVNILYFLVNVFYKQPNKSLRWMTPWLNSQWMAW